MNGSLGISLRRGASHYTETLSSRPGGVASNHASRFPRRQIDPVVARVSLSSVRTPAVNLTPLMTRADFS